MALVRWNPWGDLFNLHSQMDELFQALTPAQSMGSNGGGDAGGGSFLQLPVDIRQTDQAFIIEASVPGFAPEEVDLTFDDGVLSIKGTHGEDHEKNDGEWVRRERRVASVFRQVGLPAEVRADEITASFDNGVLQVTVPRAQRSQPKRIPVTATAGAPADEQRRVIEHHSDTR